MRIHEKVYSNYRNIQKVKIINRYFDQKKDVIIKLKLSQQITL